MKLKNLIKTTFFKLRISAAIKNIIFIKNNCGYVDILGSVDPEILERAEKALNKKFKKKGLKVFVFEESKGIIRIFMIK